MDLPFTSEQFLGVFAAYNLLLWPFAVALWVLSALALLMVMIGRSADRATTLLLAVHWAWSAVAYHLVFFADINPAAVAFAIGFLVQAAILAIAVANPPSFSWRWRTRNAAGAVLAVYSLIYPLLTLLAGHSYPRMPTFGVPCPTTLYTIGILLMSAHVRRSLLAIPLAWSIIGGSAALLLGMTPDYALLLAGLTVLIVVSTSRSVTSGSTGHLS
jgi:hypothetical protein